MLTKLDGLPRQFVAFDGWSHNNVSATHISLQVSALMAGHLRVSRASWAFYLLVSDESLQEG